MISEETVCSLLNQAYFKEALSMPKIPHAYSHRENWINDKDFVDVVLFIREHGIEERFSVKRMSIILFTQYTIGLIPMFGKQSLIKNCHTIGYTMKCIDTE